MKVNGRLCRTIWRDGASVAIIDQTRLPHAFEVKHLRTCAEVERAVREMWVRGAPLIGVTAAYGMALAMQEDSTDWGLAHAYTRLLTTRPTAVNLRWALDRVRDDLRERPVADRGAKAWQLADEIADEDVAINAALGRHGAPLIAALHAKHARAINVLTHCNAGWLATVDWGTALAPVYQAHDAGVPIHVWVDETRPRNQGASLTAWELLQHGVPHTVIVDNAGGHLMQHGQVDVVIVGCDRATSRGDACNKIGTYLKALAAHDNGVPFYVGLPISTIDWTLEDGVREIPIEERSADEVTHMVGLCDGAVQTVQIVPSGSPAKNWGFDVTPARLVTGFITERGVVSPGELLSLKSGARA